MVVQQQVAGPAFATGSLPLLTMRTTSALLLALATPLVAQTPGDSTARVVVVATRGEDAPLPDALVRAGRLGAKTDSSGRATLSIMAGPAQIIVSKLGFRPESTQVLLRPGGDTTIALSLVEHAAALTSIVISSTRTERRLEDEPLRIEVLGGDDISEKNELRPADARSLLREMSGVRVQVSSASLGAMGVRIQGLRGRYTMLLSDGLPLYGTQAGGFGLAQIPPLDLRQAEVIKGAASALYGPSALGGVVNLLSRRPPDTTQLLVNRTARQGTDAMTFIARSVSDSSGFTFLGGAHRQPAVDPQREGVLTITGTDRAESRPRYFYSDGSGRTLMLTGGAFSERRSGGLAFDADSLITDHIDGGLVGTWKINETLNASARASASQQWRRRHVEVTENERQRSGFAEASFTAITSQHVAIAGVAWQADGYRNAQAPRFDGILSAPSFFIQETFTPNDWLSGTINGRCDASNRYGTICTPRLSLLAHSGEALSARVSAGAGWFAPQPLTEETEAIGLSRVQAMTGISAERALTASLDFTATHGPLQVSGTLFENRVRASLGLMSTPNPATPLRFVNSPGISRVHGGELFAVFNQEPIIATAYWVSLRSREPLLQGGGEREIPYTPRNAAGLDLAFEEEESGTYVAGEVFYTGRQMLEDDPYRSASPPYTEFGILLSKRLGRITLFANAENLTNMRQSKYEPLVLQQRDELGRRMVNAWGPIDGRTFNAGMRMRF